MKFVKYYSVGIYSFHSVIPACKCVYTVYGTGQNAPCIINPVDVFKRAQMTYLSSNYGIPRMHFKILFFQSILNTVF